MSTLDKISITMPAEMVSRVRADATLDPEIPDRKPPPKFKPAQDTVVVCRRCGFKAVTSNLTPDEYRETNAVIISLTRQRNRLNSYVEAINQQIKLAQAYKDTIAEGLKILEYEEPDNGHIQARHSHSDYHRRTHVRKDD